MSGFKTSAVVAVVLLNGVLLVSFLGRQKQGHEHGPESGGAFPLASARSLSGENVDWANRWLLAISFSVRSNEGLRLAQYGSVLQRRYANRGLKVVGLISGDRGEIDRVTEDVPFNYPLVDASGVSDQLRLEGHEVWVIFVNPKGRVVLSAPTAQTEDLRQITERHIVGAIDYTPGGYAGQLKEGAMLPDAVLEDLRTRSTVALRAFSSREIVLVTARCTVCSLSPTLKAYRDLEVRSPTFRGAIIFSQRFTRAEVLAQADRLGVRAQLLQEQELSEALEDAYRETGPTSHDVVVIQIDSTGVIERMKPWSQFLASSETGS